MICALCGHALRGFADGRIIEVRIPGIIREKVLACVDVDACNARVAENERKRTGGTT